MADKRIPIRRRSAIQECDPWKPDPLSVSRSLPGGILVVLFVCAGFAGLGFHITFLLAFSDFEPQKWVGIAVTLLFATHMTLITLGLTLRWQWGWWNAVFSFGLFSVTALYVAISCLGKGAVSDCIPGGIESVVMLGIASLVLATSLCSLLANRGAFFAPRQGGIPAVGKRDRD